MHRVSTACALALAALVTALPAGGAGTARAIEGECSTDTLVVLFWPRGHVAIPQLGFARATAPRVVALTYAGAGTLQKAYILATASGRGSGTLLPACPRTRMHTTSLALPARATTQPAAITCRTRGRAVVQLRKLTGARGGWELRVIESPDRLVLRALVTRLAAGSNLAQAPARCRSGPAPPRTSL